MTLNTDSPLGIARAGLFLLALALLLAPLATQAQSIAAFSTNQGAGTKASAKVTLSASSDQYPANISVSWGDGTSSSTIAGDSRHSVRYLNKTYANCGQKSISVSVTFNNGATDSSSDSLTVGCAPAQPIGGDADDNWDGSVTCDIEISPGHYGCRPVPNYFLDNSRALDSYLRDKERRAEDGDFSGRSLSSFGYRCPDARGLCGKQWLPSPARVNGLSNPNSFRGSELQERPGAGIQRINRDGIGIQSIIDQNPIDAVNIWGPGAESGGEVCFDGTEGRFLYVDSRVTPNTVHNLPATVKGDQICGTLPGPGSIIYLPPDS
jgi:hypothetical protein